MSIQSIGVSAQVGQVISGHTTTTGAATISDTGQATATTPASPSSLTASQTPTTAQLTKAVQDLNKSVQPSSPSLEFSLDSTNNQMVVKVVDQETNQVLMQIPSQEVIDMAQSLDKLQGLLVKLRA